MIRFSHSISVTSLGFPLLALFLFFPLWASAQPDPDFGNENPVQGFAEAEVDSVFGPVVAVQEPEEIDLWSTGANPAGAVLMSPLFPGWGQLYADNGWRSALSFGSQMWFWSRMITRDRRAVRSRQFAETFASDDPNYSGYNLIAEENWEQMRDFAWWSGGAMFIIALDAYVGSHLFHFEDNPVPVPNRWDEIFEKPGGVVPGSRGTPSVVVLQWQYRF